MQTFLPYSDFVLSARSLDMRRLGKQRVEALQILQGLSSTAPNRGWKNHPASKMWRGFEYQLAEYGKTVCAEWIKKGYKDTCFDKICEFQIQFTNREMPFWIGDEEFHESHRSNLIRKLPEFYRPQFPNTREGLPYIWPV